MREVSQGPDLGVQALWLIYQKASCRHIRTRPWCCDRPPSSNHRIQWFGPPLFAILRFWTLCVVRCLYPAKQRRLVILGCLPTLQFSKFSGFPSGFHALFRTIWLVDLFVSSVTRRSLGRAFFVPARDHPSATSNSPLWSRSCSASGFLLLREFEFGTSIRLPAA